MSKVRGGGQECQAAMAQERLRGGITHPRPGAAAGRSYAMPEARGSSREEQPRVQGAMAVWKEEGREELLHLQGQEGQP